MFDSLGSFVQSALGLVAVAAFLRVGAQRARVVELNERVEALRGEIADGDREMLKMRAARAEDKATIASQASDIKTLQRTVTGEEHWKALAEQMAHLVERLKSHHEAAEEHWSADEELLGRILQALGRRGL